jgi:glycosyltransferase involved in cell wall biosynthesis
MKSTEHKIKVCHFTSAHNWADVRIFLKECRSLSEAGYEVFLVHRGDKCGLVEGVNIIGLGSENTSRLGRMYHTANAVYRRALACDAEIYHFHDPELLRFIGDLKNRNKKIVYDVHEDVPRQILGKYWIPELLRRLVAHIFEVYENRQARKIDLIVAATPHIRDRFLKINTNTVDVCNYPLLSEFDIAECLRTKNKVCYIGALTEIRGIKEIVQAVEGTSIELHLAGICSPPNFRDELIALKGWENVKERGFLNRNEIAELVSTSQIGLVTLYPQVNYLDSLPIKMFEYMMAGLPVIASDFPLWKELINENQCGITVNPKDPNAIKETLMHLLNDSDTLKEMGKNGKQAAHFKYNWIREAEKLIEAYQTLVA